MTMIPAISMAAYTTCKVIMASAYRPDMLVLAAASGAAGLCVIVALTIWNIVQGRKKQSVELFRG